MSDDEIIGLKSTSIKFKKNIRLFVAFLFNFYNFIFIYLKTLLGIIFYFFFNYVCFKSFYQLLNLKK